MYSSSSDQPKPQANTGLAASILNLRNEDGLVVEVAPDGSWIAAKFVVLSFIKALRPGLHTFVLIIVETENVTG